MFPDPIGDDDFIAFTESLGITAHLTDACAGDRSDCLRIVDALFLQGLQFQRLSPTDNVSAIGVAPRTVEIEEVCT